MDSASLNSFIPILDGIDKWAELAPLLPIIILLELILSADNAVALASIAKRLDKQDLQNKALNIGILFALVLRIFLILTATYIIKYRILQALASLYLLWLVYTHFFYKLNQKSYPKENNNTTKKYSLFNIIVLLAVTDFAFSIDSVTAAVAISDQIFLVITGALVGVLALRYTSGLFVNWLSIYTNLEDAGFIAVLLVASKLIIHSAFPIVFIPEPIFITLVFVALIWGFSSKNKET